MAARHIGGKTHRQSERLDEHPDELDWNQDHIEKRVKAVWNDVLPMLDEAVSQGACDDDREECDRRQTSRDIEITRRCCTAVEQLVEKGFVARVQNKPIDNSERVEYRNQADGIRSQNKEEESQDKRS